MMTRKEDAQTSMVATENTPPLGMEPFVDLDKKLDEIESGFESILPRTIEAFFQHGWLRPFNWDFPVLSTNGNMGAFFPKVDVVDRDGDVLVRADIPGVAKEDIEVQVTESTLIIKGSSHKEKSMSKDDYYKNEIMQGRFSRSLTLPCSVISDSAKAQYKDGVLEISMPKQKAFARHTVPIH
jgi:HSP20 family protein